MLVVPVVVPETSEVIVVVVIMAVLVVVSSPGCDGAPNGLIAEILAVDVRFGMLAIVLNERVGSLMGMLTGIIRGVEGGVSTNTDFAALVEVIVNVFAGVTPVEFDMPGP